MIVEVCKWARERRVNVVLSESFRIIPLSSPQRQIKGADLIKALMKEGRGPGSMPVLGSRGAWGRWGWQEGKSIHGLCLHNVQLSMWGKEDKALLP